MITIKNDSVKPVTNVIKYYSNHDHDNIDRRLLLLIVTRDCEQPQVMNTRCDRHKCRIIETPVQWR